MPTIAIDDLEDPRIAAYRSLKATNATRGLDHFVVEGDKLVDRLLRSRFPVESILATDRFAAKHGGQLPDGLPLYVVPFGLVHELVGFPFHRGVLACGRRLPWPPAGEIVGRGGRSMTLAICPKISNPENLGAIARIGDVLGIDGILTGPSCPDPLSRRVLRVSMGSALSLPILVEEHLGQAVDRLVDESGLALWAAVADGSADPFDRHRRPARLGLVLGDEDEGVEAAWLARCERSITIPMRPGAGSLNVAVAAGILLYHLAGDRRGTRDGSAPPA
ncbi:Putative TrmH family tRNA/rRNA methyltransferase [Aquisphaera giovannonii]|uniref:TrmH family tRNA/rRNA methyltransferase n=1 Tax=Aquisphaera giovannonii TaxID=406548 RepID=A0A5B9W0S3_9BACT|nr:RNA methyltransferase [Aquisphaera giovannonii]QEH33897.1 Putative TrmH family tRNA/rRNA methyltransferase [Aquisphaera giovannonii]